MKNAWINRWNREQVIGLDLIDGRITAAWFPAGQSGTELKRVVVGSYDPTGSVRQIAHSIRELWRKEKLPTRTVQTCLHSRSLLVRYFQYKNLNEDELPRVLALEAEESIQLPASQIAMDWQLSADSEQSTTGNQPRTLSGTLVAAPRQKVMQHLKMIRSAGLYSIRVQTSCAALYNLLAWLKPEEGCTPGCLINLSRRFADIVMYSNGSNYPHTLFSGNCEWHENQEYLLENIQNALLYYHLKLKKAPIEQIILAGPCENMDAFPAKLATQTSLPVERLDICSSERIKHTELPDKLPCCATTAIGLALRSEDL